MMNKREWISKMKEILDAPRSGKNAEIFHSLVYEAPTKEGQEVIDLLMESFLKPFDSPTMQCCVNMLGDADIKEYYEAYFKFFLALKDFDSNEAISLFNFSGRELSDDDIKYVINEIWRLSPSGELKKEMDFLISYWNLMDVYPFSEIYYSE